MTDTPDTEARLRFLERALLVMLADADIRDIEALAADAERAGNKPLAAELRSIIESRDP